MRVSMTENAEKRLLQLAEAEKEPGLRHFRILRIFPGCGVCSGKLFLSVIMDQMAEEDTRAIIGDLSFIASPEIIFTAGDEFEIDVNGRGLFLVKPAGAMEEEKKQKFCMRPR